MINCSACGNCRKAINVGLEGRGWGNTLVVLGTVSSRDDLEGLVAAGRDGILLAELMADAGYAADEWRVTVAVRCLGDATTETIDACRPHLIEEVNRVNPSVIIAMGDVALRSLCKRAGLGNARGSSVQLHADYRYEADVYPTYSPTFIFASPKARATVVADLRRVRDRLKEDDHVKYIREPRDHWTTVFPTAIDIETDFFVTGGERVVQVGYYTGGPGTSAVVSETAPRFMSAPTIIGHNIWQFDAPVLRRNGCDVRGSLDDTMVMAYLDDESQPRGLEALCVKYLGVKGWKEGLHAQIGSEEFARYNARDVVNTYRLWEVLKTRLGRRMLIHDHVMRPAFHAFQACSERGLHINSAIASDFEAKYEADRARLLADIQAGTGIKNPNSPQQVAEYLFGNKKASADRAHLLGHPEGELILEYRHCGKMLNTFIRPYRELGRIHFPYNILGTDSGRVSARHHNMPRELKRMFGAVPGGCLVSVDYSAIEFRFAAWVAGVKNVLERYAHDPDFDPHRWFASQFYGIDERGVVKDQRQTAKSGNFGLLYKSSPEGLAEYAFKTSGIRMPLHVARAVRNAWLCLLPEIPAFWDQTEAFLKEHGYVESVTGRRRHFGDPRLLPKAGGAWNAMVREGVNHMVQSPCTDIAQTGLVLCHREGLPINGFFHDAITFEFESERAARDSEGLIRDLMTRQTVERLRDIFDVDITVPLTVDFTYTLGE